MNRDADLAIGRGRDADAPSGEMWNAKRGAGGEPSSAWGDLSTLVGLFVVWLTLTRWILPAMGFPSCAEGACGTSAYEQLQPPASEAGPIVPDAAR